MRAIAREEHLHREALRGFERSQRDQTRRRSRQITRPDGGVTTVIEADVTVRDGDPRFLEQAGRALERAPSNGSRTFPSGSNRTAASRLL